MRRLKAVPDLVDDDQAFALFWCRYTEHGGGREGVRACMEFAREIVWAVLDEIRQDEMSRD